MVKPSEKITRLCVRRLQNNAGDAAQQQGVVGGVGAEAGPSDGHVQASNVASERRREGGDGEGDGHGRAQPARAVVGVRDGELWGGREAVEGSQGVR